MSDEFHFNDEDEAKAEIREAACSKMPPTATAAISCERLKSSWTRWRGASLASTTPWTTACLAVRRRGADDWAERMIV
jgi:hypothetical protein